MVRLGCFAVVLALAISMSIPIIAAQYLPWYGVLGVILAQAALGIFLGPKIVKWIIKRVAMRLFDVKSRVMRGATVEVHSATAVPRPVRRVRDEPPAEGQMATADPTLAGQTIVGAPEEPADEEEDDEGDAPPEGTWYLRLDCTIRPGEKNKGPMLFYDPSEITLIPYDKKVSISAMLKSEGEDEDWSGSMYSTKEIEPAGTRAEIADKITGTHRLELVFQCPPSLKGRAKLRYYFEAFGNIPLPPH